VFYSIRFLSMTFYGKKSKHIEHLAYEGIHIHEAKPVMWVPYAILATFIIGLGLIGPYVEGSLHGLLEPFFHETYHFSSMIRNSSPIPVQAIAVAMSMFVLALGGILSYRTYITRKPDPEDFLNRHKTLKAFHMLVWNRWYINSSYYKVFVDGVVKLTITIDKMWESAVIYRISPAVAQAATNAYHGIKRIQTGVLSYNMVYVVITLLILTIFLLLPSI